MYTQSNRNGRLLEKQRMAFYISNKGFKVKIFSSRLFPISNFFFDPPQYSSHNYSILFELTYFIYLFMFNSNLSEKSVLLLTFLRYRAFHSKKCRFFSMFFEIYWYYVHRRLPWLLRVIVEWINKLQCLYSAAFLNLSILILISKGLKVGRSNKKYWNYLLPHSSILYLKEDFETWLSRLNSP